MATLLDAQTRQITSIRDVLGLTEDDLARALLVDRRTVQRWLAGATLPQAQQRAGLDALERFVERLEATFGDPAAIRIWLEAESGYLGTLRPREVLLTGRIDALDRALDALDAGIFV